MVAGVGLRYRDIYFRLYMFMLCAAYIAVRQAWEFGLYVSEQTTRYRRQSIYSMQQLGVDDIARPRYIKYSIVVVVVVVTKRESSLKNVACLVAEYGRGRRGARAGGLTLTGSVFSSSLQIHKVAPFVSFPLFLVGLSKVRIKRSHAFSKSWTGSSAIVADVANTNGIRSRRYG